MKNNKGKFDKFRNIVITVGAISCLTVLGSTGLGIEQGNFAVEKHAFTGSYNENVIPAGMRMPQLLDSIMEFNGRERIIDVNNIRAKDSDNILLEDMDMTVNYKAKPEGIVNFIKNTDDISSGESGYVVGQKNVEREARSVIQTVTQQYTSQQLLKNQDEFERHVQKSVQEALDEKYPDAFKIIGVRAYSIKFGKIIEQKIQSIQKAKAEDAKAQAELATIDARKTTALAEAKMIAEVAKESGLTVDQYLESRRIKVIEESNSVSPVVSLDSKSGSSNNASKPKM